MQEGPAQPPNGAAKLRTLTAADAEALKRLRLRALLEHPEAFGNTPEALRTQTLASVAEKYLNPSPDAYTLGAFKGLELCGSLFFYRLPLEYGKTRHRANIGGMYVAPQARREGLGRALLTETIARATALPDLEQLVLAVTVGNDGAKRLYEALGFRVYCVDPDFLKLAGTYYAVEWLKLELSIMLS